MFSKWFGCLIHNMWTLTEENVALIIIIIIIICDSQEVNVIP